MTAETMAGRLIATYTFEQALRDRYQVERWEDLIDAGIVVYGTPEDCIEQLEQIEARGADALLMQPRFADVDRAFSRESFIRLARDVLPHVGTQRNELVPTP